MLLNSGALGSIDESFSQLKKQRNALPDFSRAPRLLLVSDYGGEHDTAIYRSFSFLLADDSSLGEWVEEHEKWRSRFLSDGRRMSYKGLNDRHKRRALRPFLSLANLIIGLQFTLLVHRRLRPLVELAQPDEDDLTSSDAASLTKRAIAGGFRTNDEHLFHAVMTRWKPRTRNKVLLIASIVGVLVGRLSHPGQHLLWITDDDAVAANEAILRDFVDVAGYILSAFLPHSLGHLRIGTAGTVDNSTKRLEDMTALPDLVAGALADILRCYSDSGVALSSSLITPRPESLPFKARTIMDWYSEQGYPLKRLTFVVDPPEAPEAHLDRITVRRLKLHGSNDYE